MSTLVQIKYGYDQASNRLYRRDEVARSHSALFDELYDYDGLHRLTEMDRGELDSGNTGLDAGPSLTQDWTLDATGNWKRFEQGISGALDQTREHNAVNEITDIDKTVGALWPTPVYDNNGNTTLFPDPRSLTAGVTGTYDAWNRLVKVRTDEMTPKTVAEYIYDGLNRRITKTVPTLLGSVTRHAYFSDQWQVLEERTDSNSFADQQFVWGLRYVDDLVLRDRFDVGPGYDNRLYALQDALFNVVALTDATGDVKERFAYQPYGLSKELDPDFDAYSGTDYRWEYRFTGRELDLETGLQLNRNRYLHLELGRWITRDPIEAGLNLYLYSGTSPLSNLDPSGHCHLGVDLPLDDPGMLQRIECGDQSWNKRLCKEHIDPITGEHCPACKCKESADRRKTSINRCEGLLRGERYYDLLAARDKVVFGTFKCAKDCGAGAGISITCSRVIMTGANKGKLEIAVCMATNDYSICQMRALVEHELTHVEDYIALTRNNIGQLQQSLDDIDRVEFERRAYTKQCEMLADQDCLRDEARDAYMSACIRNLIGISLNAGNVNQINAACKPLLGSK